jgi:hypothetical protein
MVREWVGLRLLVKWYGKVAPLQGLVSRAHLVKDL